MTQGGSGSEPDLASRIEAQGRVYDALTAEAHIRFTLQHQLVVVAAALAGAGATFLPKLVAAHPATGDYVLSAAAILFLALATGYAQHDVYVAMARSFQHALGDFNRAAYGSPRDEMVAHRSNRLRRSSTLRQRWVEVLMAVCQYVLTLGFSVAAAAVRVTRGHLFAHPAEFILYVAFITLLVGFCATAWTSIREQRSATGAELADGICPPRQ